MASELNARSGMRRAISAARWALAPCIAWLCLVLWACCPVQAGEKHAGAEAKRLAARLWSGWKAARQKLTSGRVVVTGQDMRYEPIDTAARKTEPDQVRETREIALDIAFDWKAGCIKHRVDWGDPYKGIWLLAPDRLVQWPDLGEGIVATIHKPGHDRLPFARYLDARVAGFASTSAIIDRMTTFEEIAGEVQELPQPESVEELGDNRFEIVYDQPSPDGDPGWRLRSTVVIDEARGFTVATRTQEYRKDDRVAPLLRNEAQWRDMAGAWVPVRLEAYEPQGLTRLTLEFAWAEVNAPIPSEEFELEQLGIPKGTQVSDDRTETPALLGRIGDRAQAAVRPPPIADEPVGGRPVPYLLIAANVLILLGVAAFLVKRRLRS